MLLGLILGFIAGVVVSVIATLGVVIWMLWKTEDRPFINL